MGQAGPDPPKLRPAPVHAGYVGVGRPPRRLPELKDIVIEVEQVGGLTEVLTLGVPSVLAGADDGPRRVPITVGPHEVPEDTLADALLAAMNTASVVHTPGPG